MVVHLKIKNLETLIIHLSLFISLAHYIWGEQTNRTEEYFYGFDFRWVTMGLVFPGMKCKSVFCSLLYTPKLQYTWKIPYYKFLHKSYLFSLCWRKSINEQALFFPHKSADYWKTSHMLHFLNGLIKTSSLVIRQHRWHCAWTTRKRFRGKSHDSGRERERHS